MVKPIGKNNTVLLIVKLFFNFVDLNRSDEFDKYL